MIKIENPVYPCPELFEAVVRDVRNPYDSWDKSDSGIIIDGPFDAHSFELGDADHHLMMNLANGGPVNAKYRRSLSVHIDIVAPLYWWKEFDTYKIGTVSNSCSTMHTIMNHEFTLDQFSFDRIDSGNLVPMVKLIDDLNHIRELYIDAPYPEVKRLYWYELIQKLPSSYNQRRGITLNYEVLHNIYMWRKNHKLREWRDFCKWIESIPYSELVTHRECVYISQLEPVKKALEHGNIEKALAALNNIME